MAKQSIPATYLDALSQSIERIRKGDLPRATQAWYEYPATLALLRDNPNDENRVGAESLLYEEYEAASNILAAAAERLGVDSTLLIESSRVCLRVCRDPDVWLNRNVVSNPERTCRVITPWPECISENIGRLSEHERAAVEQSSAVLARVLLKASLDKTKAPRCPPALHVTEEEQTILETLASEHPMCVTQRALIDSTRRSPKCVRGHVKHLLSRKLINQPRGSKKGYGITAAGLSAIRRS
jgi:hypothetical protein